MDQSPSSRDTGILLPDALDSLEVGNEIRVGDLRRSLVGRFVFFCFGFGS